MLRIPGQAPQLLGRARPALTLGRSPRNDVVIEDPSISRHHARMEWRDERAYIQDLGSMNGTEVNGVRVEGPVPVGPADILHLGNVRLWMDGGTDSPLLIEGHGVDALPHPTLVVEAAALRSAGAEALQPSSELVETLQLLSDVTLELLQDTTLERHLELLLDRLVGFLKPSRCAVLLRNASGSLDPVVLRGVTEGSHIRLSRTVVDAALERREAMLLNDLGQDPRLGNSPSVMLSGLISVMTAPLEFDGEVVGLLYADARLDRVPFTRSDLRLLASLAHVAAAKIRTVRLQEEVASKRIMEREFALAHQIQQRLLPHRAPELPGWELYGGHQPCREVSGDLFGFWRGDEDRLLISVADVVGKGIGPGLLMASLQAFLTAWADSSLPVGELACRLSRALAERTSVNRFVTAFLARLDPATGQVDYTSAGHVPALLLRRDGRREVLESQGVPLAVLAGEPYVTGTLRLEPGDLLALQTDGILEAADPAGDHFGLDRLAEQLLTCPERPLEAVARDLTQALDTFTGQAPLTDDRTLVLLRRR